MLKRILTVVRERRIAEVICAFFVLSALNAAGNAAEAPFLNNVVHFFNTQTHLAEYPAQEPPISTFLVGANIFDVFLFSALAFATYRWLCQKTQGDTRG